MKSYIDLTHPIEEGMPVFPGDPPPKVEELMTLGKDICTVQSIRFNNHLGTHLDAPSHFIEKGITVDRIPLETLIGRARILDFKEKGGNGLITKKDLQTYGDQLTPSGRVVINTGWEKNFRPDIFYADFPCLTLEAAEYLASRKIALLGTDTPSSSPLDDPDQKIHKTLLGAGIVLLEGLKNLDLIGRDVCQLIVLSPPFKNFSGAPCRAVAVVEK